MSAVHVMAVAIVAAVFVLYMGVIRMKVVDWIGTQFKGGAAALSDRVAGFVLLFLVLALVIAIAF